MKMGTNHLFFFFFGGGGDSKVDAFWLVWRVVGWYSFFLKTSLPETEGKHLTRWAIKRNFIFQPSIFSWLDRSGIIKIPYLKLTVRT